MKSKLCLVIPDVHVEQHDKRAVDLMVKVAADVRPDGIMVLGDFLDFYAINSYGRDPGVKSTIKDEIDAGNALLDQLDKITPRGEKVFLEGNHEYRLRKYIANNSKELYGLVPNVEDLLHLRKRGWKFIPYGPAQQYPVLGSKLMARHEPLGGGEHSAASTVKKAGASVIFGHIHRIQEFQAVMLDDTNHRAISPGWLGDKSSPVMGYVKGVAAWALGFNLVTVLPNRQFFAHTLHIIDYKCSYGGKIYAVAP